VPQTILILDFGSQTTQLIARRIREQHVYCEIVPYQTPAAQLATRAGLTGLILSGGPASTYGQDAPQPDPAIFALDVPVLGICYGMQVGCQILGGTVEAAPLREYGRTRCTLTNGAAGDRLLAGLGSGELIVWMSHGDAVTTLDGQFIPLGGTPTTPWCIVRHATRRFYGVQFHPEVTHTPFGEQLLANFVGAICGCSGDWQVSDIRRRQVEAIRSRVGLGERVICGLSGGVDSAVAAALIHEAIGERLVPIFVDNGLLRLDEASQVVSTFRDHFGIPLVHVDAGERFLDELAGVTDPETKRKRIGHLFVEVFSEEARSVVGARYLAQGTLYPDVIESVAAHGGPTAVIKSHHNVGGLPPDLNFELIEPLRELFKDEVRRLGSELGLPPSILRRHPFPGPGLAIRCLGEVTRPRLVALRLADRIVRDEIAAAGLKDRVWQAFAVLLPVRSVGVMGDHRTYDEACAVRVVDSSDGMTADWVDLPRDLLDRIARRIVNEVRGINRVVYDITSKPPGTIEWE
jgi:GMP synthase (glutamine-hydrolysing)